MTRIGFLLAALGLHALIVNFIAAGWRAHPAGWNSLNASFVENAIIIVKLTSEATNRSVSSADLHTHRSSIPKPREAPKTSRPLAEPFAFYPAPVEQNAGLIPAAPIKEPEIPRYFTAEEISRMPAMIITPELRQKISAHVSQKIVLRLLINEDGKIDDVRIDTPMEDVNEFERIKQLASEIEFIPGKINGLPVKSKIQIEMEI